MSTDPLGLGGGENLYAYVNAAPTHFIDPPGLLLFAFDGTGNQDYGAGTSFSNVVKFRDAYRADVNEPRMFESGIKKINGQKKKFGSFAKNNVFYISGAATDDQYSGITATVGDGGNGATIVSRVNTMIGYLHSYLEFIDENNSENDKPKSAINIELDTIGFSRGAASARMFASKVAGLMAGTDASYKTYTYFGRGKKWSDTPWKYNQAWLKKNCNVNFKFNFIGLWDTVPSYGLDTNNDVSDLIKLNMSLTIPDEFKKVVHAVAVNEHRKHFHGRSIFEDQTQATKLANSKNRIERGFLGAHSDIGGGYKEGDLSDVSLMWVIQEAKKAGVDFTKKVRGNKSVSSIRDEFRKVTDPIVHDSVGVEKSWANFTPGREFRWVGSDVGDGGAPMQFEEFAHLKFNWSDSLQFQPISPDGNPNNVFEQIRDISMQYVEENNDYRCGEIAYMCEEVQQIYDLKGIDADKTSDNDNEGNNTIVYGKDAEDNMTNDGYINIVAYIQWLKDSGYYGKLSGLTASQPDDEE